MQDINVVYQPEANAISESIECLAMICIKGQKKLSDGIWVHGLEVSKSVK